MNKANISLPLVRQLIQDGKSREQIFTTLHPNSYLSDKGISEWFKKFDKNPLDEQLNNVHLEALFIIADEFLCQKSLVALLPEIPLRKMFKFLDGRYSIRYRVRDSTVSELIVFDSFYGLERTIPIPNSDIQAQHYVTECKMEIIDSIYIIFHELHMYHGSTRLFLLELDFDDGKCSIIDRKSVPGAYINLYFDSTNRRNFAIGFKQDGEVVVQRVKIENSLLQIDPIQFKGSVEFIQITCAQLFNGKLYGFTPEEAGSDHVQFYEIQFDLTTRGLIQKQLYEFKSDGQIKYSNFLYDNYVCAGNIWYIPEQLYGKTYPRDYVCCFNVCKFDMTTGTFTKTAAYTLGRVLAIHVDENEIATVCVGCKIGKHEEELHRLALGQPDTLQHQTLLSMRRHAILSGNNKICSDMLEKLPPKLRPSTSYSIPVNEDN